MERGARLSGSRFAYLRGELVLLELALVRWALDVAGRHGFEPVIPPVLVREQALFGTGFLPDTEQQIYRLPDDDLYLVGTSEVALASLHAGEILDATDLPVRYAGFSPCFRREAGAAGRDTRGMFRVHQFDKVEMFSFVEPDESPAEHERILGIEEEILGTLGIPYRVVNIAVDDLGAASARRSSTRGVAARAGPLPRADVVLEHDRLPGPAARHPDAPRGRPAGDPAHAERHRGRRGAHDDRPAGERPARGRLRRAARGAGAVRSPRRPRGRDMTAGYAIVHADDVDDHYEGTDVPGEFRRLTSALGCEQLAVTLIRVPPHSDFEQGTGHTHEEIEELYLVTRGTLTMRLGDDIHEVRAGSVVRVAPSTPRSHRNLGDEPVEVWAMSRQLGRPDATKIDEFWEASPDAAQRR